RSAERLVEAFGEQVPHAPSSTDEYERPQLQEVAEACSYGPRDGDVPVIGIQDEEIIHVQKDLLYLREASEEKQKGIVLHLSVGCNANLVSIRPREVGRQLALPQSTGKHTIRTLTRTFHQAAPCQRFCDASIARGLLKKNRLGAALRRESSRTH